MSIGLALGVVAVVNLAIGYALALVFEERQSLVADGVPALPVGPAETQSPQPQAVVSPSGTLPTGLCDSSEAPGTSAEQLLASATALAEEFQQLARPEYIRDDSPKAPTAPALDHDRSEAVSAEHTPIAASPVSDTAIIVPEQTTSEPVRVSAGAQAIIANPAQLEAAFLNWRAMDPEGLKPLCVGQIEIDSMSQLVAKFDAASIGIMVKQVERLAQDTLRAGDLIAPLGRSRFLTIMPDATGVVATQLLETLRCRIEQAEITTPDGPIRTTISASATQARCDQSLESLLARSAAALREACREGRNRVACDDGETVEVGTVRAGSVPG